MIEQELVIGDKVKLITNDYGDSPDNPVWGGEEGNVVGYIDEVYTKEVGVKWNNGIHNSYFMRDLEKAFAIVGVKACDLKIRSRLDELEKQYAKEKKALREKFSKERDKIIKL